MRALRSVLFLLTLLAALPAAAEPGASAWVANEAGKVRLVAATADAGREATLTLGLHFRLDKGWKIYWRSPGDAGYPPKLDWAGSANLGQPAISWPAPKRFELAGLQNHGYADEIILPIAAPVARPGQPVRARLKVDYLACAQICVPMEARLALDLPAGAGMPSAQAHDISRFAALVPGEGARHGLTVEALEAAGSRLRLTVAATEPLRAPDLFVEPPEVASFGPPAIRLSDGGKRAVLEVAAVEGTLQRPLTEGPVTITLVDGKRSVEATLVPVAGAAAAMPATVPPDAGLAGMLLLAVLGGLILNLMPCVLPVLSIKVLGAISHGGAERSHIRAAFLASSAGIVASFLALAGAAIAVKAAGAAVGWGIQFQQPLFLGFMVALLTLFAANLWGLFEIRLPSALMNVGSGGAAHHTMAGHFLSGAFATLLATPCSAPFLGTAVGFALARGPSEILAIFAALGLGMAVPYLLVAAWPETARRFPKPGRWMLWVKKAMALALLGTALWLGTILATTLRSTAAEEAGSTAIAWVAFDSDAIARHVAEGRVVFVDVTADWCITCKVNKAAVVERGEVARRLGQPGIVAMKADWTRPDDAIARYLAGFGRYGIPFNAVYGPGAPAGIALPELLTEAEVLRALESAAGGVTPPAR